MGRNCSSCTRQANCDGFDCRGYRFVYEQPKGPRWEDVKRADYEEIRSGHQYTQDVYKPKNKSKVIGERNGENRPENYEGCRCRIVNTDKEEYVTITRQEGSVIWVRYKGKEYARNVKVIGRTLEPIKK